MSSERFFDLPAGFSTIIAFLKLDVGKGGLPPLAFISYVSCGKESGGKPLFPAPSLRIYPSHCESELNLRH